MKYVAPVRELRDRYLEQIESGALALPEGQGKYDVSRPRKLGGGFTTDPRNAEITAGIGLLDAA